MGASSFAKKLHIPNIVIGLTVVAFGTSFPEMMINVFASLEGQSSLAVGNVIGSNIVNILLVVGAAALMRPLQVQNFTVINNTATSLLQRSDGIIFIAFFIIFIYYTFVVSTNGHHAEEGHDVKEMSHLKSAIFMLLGFVGLYFGGEFIVNSAVSLSEQWGMSQRVVGILVVALGTSLPELATSLVASYKGNADMAIGNIVGSNIFNVFLVLGVSASISPISFDPEINFDLLIAFIASLLLFVFVFTRGYTLCS